MGHGDGKERQKYRKVGHGNMKVGYGYRKVGACG